MEEGHRKPRRTGNIKEQQEQGEYQEQGEDSGVSTGGRRWRSRGVEEERGSSGREVDSRAEDLYDLPPLRQTSPREDRRTGREDSFDSTGEEEFIEHPMLHQAVGAEAALDSDLFSWLESMIVTLTVLVIVTTFFCSATRVSGSSMEPTLVDGQVLFLWNMGYTPEVGDVVVVNNPTIDYLGGVSIVKRVVAVGGDRVVVDYTEDRVYVNGIALEEDYTLERMRPIYGYEVSEEVIVPEGSVFVLGDNRNNSADSRYEEIGTLDVRYILGEAVFSLSPFSLDGFSG